MAKTTQEQSNFDLLYDLREMNEKIDRIELHHALEDLKKTIELMIEVKILKYSNEKV